MAENHFGDWLRPSSRFRLFGIRSKGFLEWLIGAVANPFTCLRAISSRVGNHMRDGLWSAFRCRVLVAGGRLDVSVVVSLPFWQRFAALRVALVRRSTVRHAFA
jgi:hypothetical protein